MEYGGKFGLGRDEPIFGLKLVEEIARRHMTSVRVVGISVHLAPGDPVKSAVEQTKSRFPHVLLEVTSKDIDSEETVKSVLDLLR
jgi:hypothetical protein